MSQLPANRAPDNLDLPTIDGQAAGLPEPMNPVMTIGQVWTNLDTTDPDGMRLMNEAQNSEPPALADNVNLTFDLYAYVTWNYRKVIAETGEVEMRNRLVIITHEGNFFASGGYYTMESLGKLVRQYGPGPWHPPLKVKVQSFPNDHGGRIYKLVPVASESKRMPWQPQKAKGGKGGA